VPLMRSLWLAKKRTKSVALRIIAKPQAKRVDFEIIENVSAKDVGGETVSRGSATCPICGFTTRVQSVRAQMKKRCGGANDARLLCVVTTRSDKKGRFYRLPTENDLEAVSKAVEELERRKKAYKGELSLVPDEPTPLGGGSGAGRAFSQRNYGMDRFSDLFTSRQALALTTLVKLVRKAGDTIGKGIEDDGLGDAVLTCLALAVDRQADYLTSLVVWANTGEFIAHTFGRQALPIVWEWPECNPWGNGSGNWEGAIGWIWRVIEANDISVNPDNCNAETASATTHPLPDDSAHGFFTDPPYYDAIPYADLSDFFIPWLRRTAGDIHDSLFKGTLSPKDDECIVDEVKGKDKAFFENSMTKALSEGRRVLAPRHNCRQW